LSATIAFSVGAPTRVPDVWSFGRRTNSNVGSVALATKPWNSRSRSAIRVWSGMLRL
jgi:hypothetical protein